GHDVMPDWCSGFRAVFTDKNWTDAQSYCRQHYTDLASVRNQAENDQLKTMSRKIRVWIGLYRGQWKWSDGTPMSFRQWNHDPAGGVNILCGLLDHSKWTTANCDDPHFFMCYASEI
uniref:C-type lectin domain-containing protein n=1 Tax=Amphiprion ocellaris TaxID=80972 RepID=A0AAQ5XJ88_AMPOC